MSSAGLKLAPLRPFIRPKRYEPTNPPRLPTELIAAIPPAAAVSRRKVCGIDQKGGTAHQIPRAVSDKAPRSRIGFCANAAPANPHAASVGEAIAYRFRSPVRSERRATTTIALAPTAYGIDARSATRESL